MINKKKIIELNKDEEIIIVDSNNNTLHVKLNKGKFKVTEASSEDVKVNMKITNLNYDELKRFSLFESYYQNTIGEDLNKSLVKNINKLMDHRMDVIYGKYNREMEIIDTEYQCITYYE